ncbi:MAG: ribonuclease III [Lachnospiraceae bacterium]|jgi:ribonuclease-3|nr:ribonuclease III [Lachnospiraceae bacterium]
MELESKIGYHFQEPEILNQALRHSSFCNEQLINRPANYERLEFLGDAVLQMVCSANLYLEFPELSEGELSRLRAGMVCESALAICGKKLSLGEYIALGKGEEASGGRKRKSIIADVVEALIGAIFLDGGFEAAQTFIKQFVLYDLANKKVITNDSKSELQVYVQRTEHQYPIKYKVVDTAGPEHSKVFHVEVLVGDHKEPVGSGVGRSIKAAEQQAAFEALYHLQSEE